MHVFPVFAVQCPSDNEEDTEEQHDLLTHLNSGLLKRLSGVSQKIHQILHCIIKLIGGHDTRGRNFQRIAVAFACMTFVRIDALW